MPADKQQKSDIKSELGLYARRFAALTPHRKRALFLDRDGVIVEEVNYLHKVDDVLFIPHVAAAIARANRLSIPVVMVTNQSGIGRGYYGWDDFAIVQKCIGTYYAAQSAHFDMVLACAYHAEGLGFYAVADHPWRKPNPGMLLEAARALNIDLCRSFIIGDSITDLVSGHAAGLAAGALVRTGHGVRDWQANGEAQFHAWRTEGRFMPLQTDDAAQAIHQWLNDLASGLID